MNEAQSFPPIQIVRKTGAEPLRCGDVLLKQTLLDFWRWSASDLVGNAIRGHLAEYIVTCALELPDTARVEWEAVDLVTPEGLKIEVKSAAYLQSWNQKAFSKITFGIQPTLALEAGTNIYEPDRKRQADIYIFCLLHHQNKATVDPLDTAQWTFYMLPALVLDERLLGQKTIGFTSLLKLNPLKASYSEMASCVASLTQSKHSA